MIWSMSPQPRSREPKSATWEDRLSAQVGKNIAAARGRLGVSAQWLSDRLGELGAPLPRPTISQIETGQRTVSLAEAISIAAALGVPPDELVFDPEARSVEALPGREDLTGEEACAWMAGEIPMRRPGEPKALWFGDLESHYGREGSLEWILLGRMERWLYGLDQAIVSAGQQILALRNGPKRAAAVESLQSATRSAINQARALQEQAAALQSRLEFDLDPETKDLIAHRIERDPAAVFNVRPDQFLADMPEEPGAADDPSDQPAPPPAPQTKPAAKPGAAPKAKPKAGRADG
jgi:transcriptional regulator with XRE-family HTH domain